MRHGRPSLGAGAGAGVRRSLAAALHCLLAAGLVSATTMPAVVQPAAHSAAIPALRVAGLLQQQPQPQRRSLRASSPCPRGMRRVRPADRQRALESGRHVFAWHIQELCGRMPLHVTEPLRFGLRMAPRCANAARTRFTLLLSYLSPCDGGRRVKYSLDVDWRPQRRCPADFWPLATYVEAIRQPRGMRPLQCPPGFGPGRREVVGNVLDVAFLERLLPTLRGTRHWCEVGLASVAYEGFNGCTSTGAGQLPLLVAEGQARYTCYGRRGAAQEKRIGFRVVGSYRRQCFDQVTALRL